MDELRQFFPNPMLRYRLVENDSGFTLDGSIAPIIYIALALLVFGLTYLATYLSYYYAKTKTPELSHAWLLSRPLIWVLSSFWIILSLFFVALVIGAEIPKLRFDLNKKELRISYLFTAKTVPFSEIGTIRVDSHRSTGGTRYSSPNTSYYLSGSNGDIRMLDLQPTLGYKKHETATSEGAKLANILNQIINNAK